MVATWWVASLAARVGAPRLIWPGWRASRSATSWGSVMDVQEAAPSVLEATTRSRPLPPPAGAVPSA
jgi:hypothetical protein